MTTSRSRPYLSASVMELETLFERSHRDNEVLRSLASELDHRTTERAGRLRARVEAALSGRSPAQGELYPPKAGSEASDEGNASGDTLPPLPRTSSAPTDDLPPLLELDDLPVPALPAGDNEPAAILSAWTALEALAPQTYKRPFDLVAGDRRRIVDMKGNDVPWPHGRSIPDRKLYYQVPLGTIAMNRATHALVTRFGADEEMNRSQTERSVIAAVLVDRDGRPLEENAVAVSSFAWALPQVLKGKLASLGAWTTIEDRLVEALTKVLIQSDEDGEIVPLTRRRIDLAHDWLVRQLGLDEEMVEKTRFAQKVFHYYKSKEPPEVSLLNSFFLRDLEQARRLAADKSLPPGLRRYLGMDRTPAPRDLLSDRTALEDAVAPKRIAPIRWPALGGHPLVLLQQAAVNLARSELDREGIIAVNGPPGTGKTTLLRDVVAACVLDRARAMATFENPNDAFESSGERVAMGSNAFFHLYRLDPSLKGHEIVVASSNNKAVENVSRELPARDAVGRDVSELSYLRTLSDHVHARASAREGENGAEGSNEDDPPEGNTWGMIAAVLGNAKNRQAFVQSFWFDADRGLQSYLKAAKGQSVVHDVRDENGKLLRRETPTIVRREAPPGPDRALGNWHKARKRFHEALGQVERELATIEKVRSAVRTLADRRTERDAARAELASTQEQVRLAADQWKRQQLVHADVSQVCARHVAALETHDAERPGFLARLFRSKAFKAWSTARVPLVAVCEGTRAELERKDKSLNEAKRAHEDRTIRAHELAAKISALDKAIAEAEGSLAPWRAYLRGRIVDDAFFASGHEATNLTAPWVPDDLHAKREEVFVAAMALHRAFIDVAAQKLQHNIGVLMKGFGEGLVDPKKRALLPDLWSSLFLVVPVVSTTFASVDRMMKHLPLGSIGWLLVDEAGQAVPQAAVGAILRSKRTIVVGDPLQIPPVVTLPERLVRAVADEFRVESLRWTAPHASAQTLADAASTHQASFRGEVEPRRVGVPLLVHRRCQDPMFSISNMVAYDRQMVHAAGAAKVGSVTDVLGCSRWFAVDGDADTKWCPAEGDMVVRLLDELARKRVRDPDLFVITPFRDVANGIRERLKRENGVLRAFGVDPEDWLQNRIGTIHTVQGREAEAVILLLGAPAAHQGGARAWAAATPNIVNVAVSRAKQSLYVVGSHGAWSGVGHARTLADALPIAGMGSEGWTSVTLPAAPR